MTIPPAIWQALGSAALGGVLASFLQSDETKPDPWAKKEIFNARMKELHGLFLALNDGFAKCPEFMKSAAQLGAWRATRDSFGKFYGGTGTLVYLTPTAEQIEVAKNYASKLYFWNAEYNRLACGGKIIDDPTPKPQPQTGTDWGAVAKWSAIGLGVAFVGRTIADLVRPNR